MHNLLAAHGGRPLRLAIHLLLFAFALSARPAHADFMMFIDEQIDAHPGQTGVYVLDRGEDALRARAWLAEHARDSIEVQYFIWSTDNIGKLAAEALLRAAERGVKVRVLVDDLLIDAPDRSLLALALHPNIDIRVYNPKHKVGTPLPKRLLNIALDFRGVNQRMHDKTFIVDGRLAITGGRNMADEYFDYDGKYNFRDRDVLLLGDAVSSMRANFENFWTSRLSVPVESRFDGLGLFKKNVRVDSDEVQQIYQGLHEYAQAPENYSPVVRAQIVSMPQSFQAIARDIAWGPVEFIHDRPGKNDNRLHLGGGGRTAEALAKLAASAQQRITIQSPYVVLSDKAIALFERLIERGVKVRISTNSLAATDNIQAFSGYRNQRTQLLKMGIELYEYRPDPQIRATLMPRAATHTKPPVFAIHAKTMVVDGQQVYIGTYNLDPRSENLNTEVGVVIQNASVARSVEQAIETDMEPGNSWRAADDRPDRHGSLFKRSRIRLWQQLPIKPLL